MSPTPIEPVSLRGFVSRGAAAVAAALLAFVGAGCTSVPLAPIPEPLPESLEWAVAGGDGAFLGLKTEERDSGSLDALFFLPGARVTRVVENSPASGAGLQAGDVVLALDGEELNDPAALDALVARRAPGAAVTLTVERGDTVWDVPVTLAALGGPAAADPAMPRFRRDNSRTRAGWTTVPQGVRLASIAPDGPLADAGLAIGDIVVALDGVPVASDRELIRRLVALEPGTRVDFTMLAAGAEASGATRTERVTLQEQPTRVTGAKLPILFTYEAAPDGSSAGLELIDLWVLSLFEYEREGEERHYTLLKVFGWRAISFSAGEGELAP